jgi:hypothetical protein
MLSELQATAKLRNQGSLPIGISWFAPTVNHCSAHETWSHAKIGKGSVKGIGRPGKKIVGKGKHKNK